MKFLDSVRPQIIAATRIVVGFLFAQHGLDKFTGVFGGGPDELDSILIVGGLIELVGGALVCVGLQTRLAAFICSGTMAHSRLVLVSRLLKGLMALKTSSSRSPSRAISITIMA